MFCESLRNQSKLERYYDILSDSSLIIKIEYTNSTQTLSN